MTRWILMTLVVLLWSHAALGASDPRPDVLGVYFDANADQTCRDNLQLGTLFSVYLVYTNPSVAEILGFEAGYYMTGNFLEVAVHWPCGIIWTVQPDLDNLYVACGEPFPAFPATPLVQFDYFYGGGGVPEGTFHVEKASGSAEPGPHPNIIRADGSLMNVEAGYPAYILSNCGLPAEKVEWGSVKTLYR